MGMLFVAGTGTAVRISGQDEKSPRTLSFSTECLGSQWTVEFSGETK